MVTPEQLAEIRARASMWVRPHNRAVADDHLQTGTDRAELLRLIGDMQAGSDPTPPTPGVRLTPGQWWHKLLQLDEDERLDRLAIFMAALAGVQAVRRLADSIDRGLVDPVTAEDLNAAVFGRRPDA